MFFRQKAGSQSLTIFEGRNAIHKQLAGEIWARVPDYAPLRISIISSRKVGEATLRDEAEVEYVMSPHGVMLPTAVVHRQFRGKDLMAEDVFHYAPFRRFAAESEIKFTEVPAEPPK